MLHADKIIFGPFDSTVSVLCKTVWAKQRNGLDIPRDMEPTGSYSKGNMKPNITTNLLNIIASAAIGKHHVASNTRSLVGNAVNIG